MRMTKWILRIIVEHEHRTLTLGVRFFTVLRDIHSDTLGADRCAQRDHQADQLENSECSGTGVCDRYEHTDCLNPELRGVSEQQAVRTTPSRFREHSGKQRTTHSANTVCAQHIERIVEACARTPQNHEVARHCSERAHRER